MKTVITHISPDLDAITASWLVVTYMTGWENATFMFVPSGKTLNDLPPDVNKDSIHVDTGFGQFDHHQTDEFTSASKKILHCILSTETIEEKTSQALIRIVQFVNEIDHFQEVHYPDADSDKYDFLLNTVIEAMKHRTRDDDKLMRTFFPVLDSLVSYFKRKIDAENDIDLGYIFNSRFGKSLALETKNGESSRLAQKKGFKLVVTKDPVRGNIRIKAVPNQKFDLTNAYSAITKIDRVGTWFLHPSKTMLLNGSSTNPTFVPSSLTLRKVIEILQKM